MARASRGLTTRPIALGMIILAIGLLAFAASRLGAPEPPAAATSPPTAASETPTAPRAPRLALSITNPSEAAAAAALLAGAGFEVGGDGAAADVTVTDQPLTGASPYVLSSWALIVHPRAPVLDLSLAEATHLLEGSTRTWADLVPSEEARALTVLVPASAQPWLSRTTSSPGTPPEVMGVEEIVARVATDPDAIGLVPTDALDLSVRALTVDGYDPYRDPGSSNLLADRRWVIAPRPEEEARVAELLGWANSTFDPVGFLATGELIPARCTQVVLAEAEGGFDLMFDGTRDLIGAADLAMASWEPAIVDDTPTPCTETFNMSTAPEAADATARAGIDVALAIGNHTGDCWTGCGYTEAILQTLQHLRAAGLVAVGAGENLEDARRPAIIEVGGVTFAVLGYDEISAAHYGALEESPGTNPLNFETLGEDVRAAKAQADHVIVGFSWGVEYTADPTERQREAARIAIEAGASLVVGNHPHWVQATERIGEGFVAYGLGNFVFDQDWSVETTQGAVLEVGFTRDRILGIRLRPTSIRERHLVEWVPVASEDGRAILEQSWAASDRLASPE